MPCTERHIGKSEILRFSHVAVVAAGILDLGSVAGVLQNVPDLFGRNLGVALRNEATEDGDCKNC